MAKITKSTASLRRRRAALDRQEAKLAAALSLLQIECQHHTPTMRYRGYTGNYDPSNDSHWIEWACPDCEKRWITDQSREATRAYPNAVRIR